MRSVTVYLKMDTIIDILRDYPAITLFLTVGTGFLIGKLRIGSFSLGSVTAVLIVGVIVGQLNITISGPIKMFFFMMFLFSIGYSVGPDFFRSLRGQGLRQALFAVVMSCICFISVLIMAKVMGYSKGECVGLFSGSETCSALLGVGSEVISKMDIGETARQEQLNIIPVCYAVTYIFGTLGTVIILGNLGPKLLGGKEKVKAATSELEKELTKHDNKQTDELPDKTDNGDKEAPEEEYVEEPKHDSDLMFVGLSIAIGGIFGALSIWVKGIPISLGTSGGALVAGLVFGWLRTRTRSIGHIAPGALWIMNNLGLNLFIAVIGIESGPTFISGLQSVGPILLVVGIITTTVPLLAGLWIGNKLFKFNPAITLGCCAGTRTCTAALGAVQNSLGSTLPTIGYAVTYAVSNILLVIWGLLMVIIV